ncbi:hypothetical protein EXIGLDRAFT_737511 [Exidia glandulosa HHB12029]|uniref:Uncharacterized protein n=1 Tax=Exidia glandulosa HHB12029 TaxID=1314781 RepID=A0A165IYR5_EXIGL|nr:hypothetical protein EXIGLDRAFT_737511 [Exidia glandulosa HHB12029]
MSVNQSYFQVLFMQIKIVHDAISSSLCCMSEAHLLKESLEWLYRNLYAAYMFLTSRRRAHRLVLIVDAYHDRKKVDYFCQELEFAIQLYRVTMAFPTALLAAEIREHVEDRSRKNIAHQHEERSRFNLQQMPPSTSQTPVKGRSARAPLSPLDKGMNMSDTDVVYNHRRRIWGNAK